MSHDHFSCAVAIHVPSLFPSSLLSSSLSSSLPSLLCRPPSSLPSPLFSAVFPPPLRNFFFFFFSLIHTAKFRCNRTSGFGREGKARERDMDCKATTLTARMPRKPASDCTVDLGDLKALRIRGKPC